VKDEEAILGVALGFEGRPPRRMWAGVTPRFQERGADHQESDGIAGDLLRRTLGQ